MAHVVTVQLHGMPPIHFEHDGKVREEALPFEERGDWISVKTSRGDELLTHRANVVYLSIEPEPVVNDLVNK